MQMKHMQQIYQVTTREPCQQLDKLNQYLLYNFSDQLAEFETYKTVDNGTWFTATDNAMQCISDDFNLFGTTINAMRDNIETLAVEQDYMKDYQTRIINLENTVRMMMTDNQILQNRVLELESINTKKQTDEDK
jgi:hypothetical protein